MNFDLTDVIINAKVTPNAVVGKTYGGENLCKVIYRKGDGYPYFLSYNSQPKLKSKSITPIHEFLLAVKKEYKEKIASAEKAKRFEEYFNQCKIAEEKYDQILKDFIQRCSNVSEGVSISEINELNRIQEDFYKNAVCYIPKNIAIMKAWVKFETVDSTNIQDIIKNCRDTVNRYNTYMA